MMGKQNASSDDIDRIFAEAQADQGIFSWLAVRPALEVLLLTLFGYLVAITFLDGYLRFYSASAHWFDPSVFQLIAFARVALFLACCVVILWYLLATSW